MAAESVFLDTSLLVAASVEEHPSYEASIAFIAKLETTELSLCISPQICREFLSVLTRKPVSGRAFTVKEALSALNEWRAICAVLEENSAVVATWEQLVSKHEVRGKQVHDCNVVATMLEHRVRRLGTRNPSDFERYEDLITVDHVLS